MTQFGQTYLQSRASFFTESAARHRNNPGGRDLYLLTYVTTESNQLYLTKLTDYVKQWTVSVTTPDSNSFRYACITWNTKGVYVLTQSGLPSGSTTCNITRFSPNDGSVLNTVSPTLSSSQIVLGIHSVFDTGEVVIISRRFTFLGGSSVPIDELHKYDFELNLTLSNTNAYEYDPGSGVLTTFIARRGIGHFNNNIPITMMGAEGDIYVADAGFKYQTGGGPFAPRHYFWGCPRIRLSDLRWNYIDADTLLLDTNFNSWYGYTRSTTSGASNTPTANLYPVSDWGAHILDQRNIAVVGFDSASGNGSSVSSTTPPAGRDSGRSSRSNNNFTFDIWEGTRPHFRNEAGLSMTTYNDPYMLSGGSILIASSRGVIVGEQYDIATVFPDANEEVNPRVHVQLTIERGPTAVVLGSYSSFTNKIWLGIYDYQSGTVATTFKNYDHEDIDLPNHTLRWAALAQAGEGRYGFNQYSTKGSGT